jgi:hypothetical protein
MKMTPLLPDTAPALASPKLTPKSNAPVPLGCGDHVVPLFVVFRMVPPPNNGSPPTVAAADALKAHVEYRFAAVLLTCALQVIPASPE